MMVLMSLDMTDAYAAGPPLSTCTSMTPNHDDATTQTTPAPYTIRTSVTCYTPGRALTGNALISETRVADFVKASVIIIK